ncbi:MAG: acyl-CoA carboxylase subunit beta, partial [Pseudomonadota bacterium]|nr:acyl-CoA carboxylase subunit beta [Pseudomonadota bacterium]
MPLFASKISPSSDAFKTNRAEMLALIERLADINGRSLRESEKRKPRFEARGQLTPRERLSRLVDPGLPFLEIGNLAGYLLDTRESEASVPGGSVIAGLGFISGVRVAIVVDDSGINAGAMTAAGNYRLRRCQQIALEKKLPFIHLVESAGADLMKYTVEGFVAGGGLFANLARLSK